MRSVLSRKKLMAWTTWAQPKQVLVHCCNNPRSIYLRPWRLRAFSHGHWATWYWQQRLAILGTHQSLVLEFRKRHQVLVWSMPSLLEWDTNLWRQERRSVFCFFLSLWYVAESDLKDWKYAKQGYFLPENIPLPEWKGVCLWIWKWKCLHLLYLEPNMVEEGASMRKPICTLVLLTQLTTYLNH